MKPVPSTLIQVFVFPSVSEATCIDIFQRIIYI